jgi:hypothetical protein
MAEHLTASLITMQIYPGSGVSERTMGTVGQLTEYRHGTREQQCS